VSGEAGGNNGNHERAARSSHEILHAGPAEAGHYSLSVYLFSVASGFSRTDQPDRML
jgi:hypothetical protein